MCYWNVGSDLPEYVASSYGNILNEIPGLAGDFYLSVKAPAIHFDMALLKVIIDQGEIDRGSRPF